MRGTLEDVLAHFKENKPRGEFVIIIGGCSEKSEKLDNTDNTDDSDNAEKPKKLSKYQRKQLEKGE